jgi:hypothetical protein
MNGIGTLTMLTSSAAQPFGPGAAAAVDTSSPTSDPSADASATSAEGNLAGDYSMKVLSLVTHSSADQALTLIQSLLPKQG